MTATRKKTKRGGKRPGAGRPATLRNPTVFALRLEQETVDELAHLADGERRPLATYARQVLEAHVRVARRAERRHPPLGGSGGSRED